MVDPLTINAALTMASEAFGCIKNLIDHIPSFSQIKKNQYASEYKKLLQVETEIHNYYVSYKDELSFPQVMLGLIDERHRLQKLLKEMAVIYAQELNDSNPASK